MTVIENRYEVILPLCEGKRVPDLRCGDPTENSLHRKISKYADYAVGVDIDESFINSAREAGYNVEHGDAENFDLGKNFDFAVLSELIEHVSNPGLVLENVREHLLLNGIMIISIPNPFTPLRLKQDSEGQGEPNHVSFFSPRYFSRLARRFGFEEEDRAWVVKKSESIKGKDIPLFWLISKKWTAYRWIGIYSLREC